MTLIKQYKNYLLFIIIMIRHFSYITKINKPCIKCVNYIKHKYKNPYDELYDSRETLGTCAIFGNENLVTGEVEYECALTCRTDSSKCGKNGKYFSLKK